MKKKKSSSRQQIAKIEPENFLGSRKELLEPAFCIAPVFEYIFEFYLYKFFIAIFAIHYPNSRQIFSLGERFLVPNFKIINIAIMIIIALIMDDNLVISNTATRFHKTCQIIVIRTLPLVPLKIKYPIGQDINKRKIGLSATIIHLKPTRYFMILSFRPEIPAFPFIKNDTTKAEIAGPNAPRKCQSSEMV
ncbi:MAG: hypothetical protein WAV32_03785 [Halobacteriota archaeon]